MNIKVLRSALKTEKVSVERSAKGREFQRTGAHEAKARLPNEVLVRIVFRISEEEERRVRGGL